MQTKTIYKWNCEFCDAWGYTYKAPRGAKIVFYMKAGCNHEPRECWELFIYNNYGSLNELINEILDDVEDVEIIK
ncbi:hypothetical protein [Candidatus Chrysopegis kryptomonas]|uniref:Uncharacterized protein n=1 Tax=Candidatus Chryseopegocella kryptomonas TaxID=1633643 RepID=A0A0P1NWB4_9BACT|nr:hypothetical protein [Candidatus Chrysopegis kryptomonas]CUT03434.1 hypothetical protein JGI23_01474 [Candidatus Chrysopegis kryptomonas]